MTTKLILIRHGQTDWNRQRKYCGFSNISLNNKGKIQAKKLYKRLSKVKIHKVYTSDLKRTVQFAKIALNHIPIEKLSELREMNFSIFENLTYSQIMKTYPEIYRKWLKNPLKVTIPKGESLGNLAKRVRKVLKKIIENNKNKTIAVFTHGGPIKIILSDILKKKLKKFWQIEINSGCINIVEFTKGRTKINILNDTSYLSEKMTSARLSGKGE